MKTTLKFSFLLAILLSGGQISAQADKKIIGQISLQTDTLILTGSFNGIDLYVQNPMTLINKDTLWTAQQVFVNDSLVLSTNDLKKTAFSIPLTKLNFKQGDKVVIMICQSKSNRVKILHAMDCGYKKVN